jgi:hypothetical protein
MKTGTSQALPAQVELSCIPRCGKLEPRIRLKVFRDSGCVLLDIRLSAFARIRQPASEERGEVLRAFRACVPVLLHELNSIIAKAPPGGIVFVTGFDATDRLEIAA